MIVRLSPRALGVAASFAAVVVYGCGGSGSTASGGTTSGSGGATATTATSATSATGTGGHGGAPGMVCPATPPQNGDGCTGFAEGQQCNYGGGLDAGVISSTECQCASGAGQPTWSCGTEAASSATGTTTSSSSG